MDEALARRIDQLIGILHPHAPDRVALYEQHGVRSFLGRFPEFQESAEAERRYQIQVSAHTLKLIAFQDALGKELEHQGIPFLALKGFSLSQVLYGTFSARAFGDLDLLVPLHQAREALRAMERMGLRRTYPRPLAVGQEEALLRYGKAQNLSQADSGVSVDLHWKLLSQWIGDDLFSFQALWRDSRCLRFPGLHPWRTLGEAHTLVFLALHGSQDGWASLKQIVDMATAMGQLQTRWESALRVAGPRRALVERSLELIGRLLQVPYPPPAPGHFRSDQHALEAWLATATSIKSPQLQLQAPSLWSCSPGEAIFRGAKAVLNPAIDDILSLSLPKPLVPLYRGVRLARLVSKALGRSLCPRA